MTIEQARAETEARWRRLEMNQRFLAEARELEGKWLKTGLLKGVENHPFKKTIIATLLENQRLLNEQGPQPMNSSWVISFRRLRDVSSSEVSRVGNEIRVSVCEEVRLASHSIETDTPSPSETTDTPF